jgi:hypothetical protein
LTTPIGPPASWEGRGPCRRSRPILSPDDSSPCPARVLGPASRDAGSGPSASFPIQRVRSQIRSPPRLASLRRETVCGVCHSPPLSASASEPEGPVASASRKARVNESRIVLAGPTPKGPTARPRTGFVYRPTTELSKSLDLSGEGRGSRKSPAPQPNQAEEEERRRRPAWTPGGRLRSIVNREVCENLESSNPRR